jgi:hypothetical protein
LQVLLALDSGDALRPVQAHLPLRALPPQPVCQDMLLGLRRRPPPLIHRQSIIQSLARLFFSREHAE